MLIFEKFISFQVTWDCPKSSISCSIDWKCHNATPSLLSLYLQYPKYLNTNHTIICLSFYFVCILLIPSLLCTISEKVVFVKWNITTNDEANQNNFINEWRGEAESWVYEIILICQVMSCDISFHKNHFFRNFISKIIVYDGLCNKFWEMILRNDFEKWYIMALVPWYIISQNLVVYVYACACDVHTLAETADDTVKNSQYRRWAASTNSQWIW